MLMLSTHTQKSDKMLQKQLLDKFARHTEILCHSYKWVTTDKCNIHIGLKRETQPVLRKSNDIMKVLHLCDSKSNCIQWQLKWSISITRLRLMEQNILFHLLFLFLSSVVKKSPRRFSFFYTYDDFFWAGFLMVSWAIPLHFPTENPDPKMPLNLLFRGGNCVWMCASPQLVLSSVL